MKKNILTELKELSLADLDKKILSLQENLSKLKYNNSVKQLENTSAVTIARKDIARALTVRNQLLSIKTLAEKNGKN